MGNHHSHGSVLSAGTAPPTIQGGTNYSPLPVDDSVYPGPKLEYRIAIVNAKMKAKMTMAMTPGQEMVSTDVQGQYHVLGQQYAEYYRLFTFFQVPLQRSQGFTTCQVPFQVPSNESWALQIQTVQIQFNMFTAGRLFSYGATTSLPPNVQGIYDTINTMAQKGGRLVCIECNGSCYSPGHYTNQFGGLIYGVDVFFDVPQHPEPKLYTYTAHSTPIVVASSYGSVQVQCDWAGTLTTYLQEGWKLVDVLIPNLESGEMERQDSQTRGHYMGRRTEQTLWFFEKEVSAVNDSTPKYQVTLVEYYVHASLSFTKVKTDFNLGSVLTEMGQKGWELCSVLDTPQSVQTGFGKGTRGIILFFQRPLLGETGGSLFIQPQHLAAASATPQGPPQFGPQGMMGARPNPPPPAGYQGPPSGYQEKQAPGLQPSYTPPPTNASPQPPFPAQGGGASPQPPYSPPPLLSDRVVGIFFSRALLLVKSQSV